MNKILFIQDSINFSDYFSPLSGVFSEFLLENTISTTFEDFKDDFLSNNNIFFAEFSDKEATFDFVENIVSKNEIVYLGVDFKKLDDLSKEKLRCLCVNEKHIAGWIDISIDVELHAPFFRSELLKYFSSTNVSELSSIASKLNGLVGFSLSELQRVKKLHERFVPIREYSAKGLRVLSKYGAGENSGGDFFDVILSDNELIVLLTSTSSYVASSIVISHFELFKNVKNSTDGKLEEFVFNLAKEVKKSGIVAGPDLSPPLEIFIMKMNLKSMKATGFVFGGFELITNKILYSAGNNFPVDKSFKKDAFFNFQFERGEKILVLSPGVRKNSSGIIDRVEMIDFFKEQFKATPESLLNELMFQLKNICKSQFFKFDASAVYLEVDTNVIIQI